MLRGLAVLALMCLGAARPEAPPMSWPVEQFVRWQPGWGARTIDVAGLRVRAAPKTCGTDQPASEGCAAGDPYLVAIVDAPGMAPATLQGRPGVAAYLGVGRLKPGSKPSVMLISEDGGSAGCVQIDIAAPERAAYRAARLSADLRDHETICAVDPARLAWPRDIAGRGRPEFLLADTIFYCRFTSCAGTWYPPRIIAFDGGRGTDVSSDPALAPLYRRDMAKARHACEHEAVEAAGACAGYVADATRVGVPAAAWRVIDAQVRRGCRVRVSGVCPDINRIPSTFPRELAAALGQGGYAVPPARAVSKTPAGPQRSLGLILLNPHAEVAPENGTCRLNPSRKARRGPCRARLS